MPNTIARIVKTQAGTFAVDCHDGNGRIASEPSNKVTLTPVSGALAVSATTLQAGFYAVRTARLLAQGTPTNTEAKAGLRAVVAHPNSIYLGTRPIFGDMSRSGKSIKVSSGGWSPVSAYLGQKTGGNSSPLGWTIVYFDGQ